jgi:hypothetical protein
MQGSKPRHNTSDRSWACHGLHLRHAIQGFGGQVKSRTNTTQRPVSQAGKHKKGSEWPNRVLTEGSWKVSTAQGEFEAATAWCDAGRLLTVKIRQPSHEFTFGVGISFIPYPLVLTPVV